MPALTDRDAFQARFRRDAEAAFFSPGRVNLIGEHTDYQDGFVLPMTVDLGLTLAVLAIVFGLRGRRRAATTGRGRERCRLDHGP